MSRATGKNDGQVLSQLIAGKDEQQELTMKGRSAVYMNSLTKLQLTRDLKWAFGEP